MKTMDFSFQKPHWVRDAARFPTRSRRRSRVEIASENETKRAIYKCVPRSMIIKIPSAHLPKSAAVFNNNRQYNIIIFSLITRNTKGIGTCAHCTEKYVTLKTIKYLVLFYGNSGKKREGKPHSVQKD